jgi:NTP pyrophosphatase (non-canonical NTP hydrolase)
MASIEELVSLSHKIAKEKGWHEEKNSASFPENVALLHSEISEALEQYRCGKLVDEVYYSEEGKPEGIPVELADVCIRIFDLCGKYNIPLEKIIKEKIEFNKTRSFRHGNKRI